MGGTLKSLLVKLGVDAKDFDQGMDSAEGKTKHLTGAFDNLSKVGMGILAGAATVIGAGAVALASTIKPATDLQESINAVNVVFAEGAEEILKFGENSATAVGLSSREFGQLSAEMGAMLGNVGIAEADLAGETINLVERASDMASIFNKDVNQAFGAIQSAIKGEFNPLEQFGVKMNMAMIEAKALSMGLVETSVDTLKVSEASIKLEKAMKDTAKAQRYYAEDSLQVREALMKQEKAQAALESSMAGTSGTISDQAKAQAALALVYEQTDKLAGDFQNTSGGLANSQRILAAVLEDTKAKIGAGLTPAMEGLAGVVKDIAASPEFAAFLEKVIKGVTKLGDWITRTVPVALEDFKKFKDFLSENEGIVVGFFVAAAVAVAAFAISLLPAIWGMITLIAPFLAIAAVAYLVYEAWTNNWGGIQEKTAAVIKFIVDTFNNFKTKAIEIWNAFIAFIQPLIDAFTSAMEGDWYSFGENLRLAWDNMWQLIRDALSTAGEWLSEKIALIIDNIVTWFTETDWKEVGLNIIRGIANGITNAVGFLKDAAVNAAKAAFKAASGFLKAKSPSMLFAELGKNMMLGMATGISGSAQVPVSVTQKATKDIATTAGNSGGSETAGMMQQFMGQQVLDENKLARILRDLMLQVSD